jgi:hypothetical protein
MEVSDHLHAKKYFLKPGQNAFEERLEICNHTGVAFSNSAAVGDV